MKMVRLLKIMVKGWGEERWSREERMVLFDASISGNGLGRAAEGTGVESAVAERYAGSSDRRERRRVPLRPR